jgi:thiol-disulfide isomerase/thioredoxin
VRAAVRCGRPGGRAGGGAAGPARAGKYAGPARVAATVWVLLGVLAVTTVAGLLWSRRQGRVRAVVPADSLLPTLRQLGLTPGDRATLLQFSSAFCAPCRATKRILGEVAEVVPGVRHLEVDAEAHLDVVRRLNILKTPTTLVLDAQGRVTQRAAGQPRKEHILAALDKAVG